jgi:hypothetical protein
MEGNPYRSKRSRQRHEHPNCIEINYDFFHLPLQLFIWAC